MELKEAVEKLKAMKDLELYYFSNGYSSGKVKLDNEDKQAIDTVLEELNNSISKDKIENKIKELKEKLENVRNKEDRIINGVAIIVLEYCIDSMNELLNK